MKKEDTKQPRASQTRSKSERPKVWVPPSSLDAPPAPKGFRYRWIRAEVAGFQDTKNIQGRIREGYELVRAEEIRKCFGLSSHRRRSIQGGSRGRWPFACKGSRRDCAATYRLYDTTSYRPKRSYRTRSYEGAG